MKTVTFSSDELLKKPNTLFKHIIDFQTLGASTGCTPKVLAYARKFKHEHRLQTKVTIGDRVTYKSAKSLAAIQNKFKNTIFLNIFNSLKSTQHILAYKKGFNYREELQTCTDNSLQISFDIKKCYDSISFKHIVKMLQHYGFTHKGAKLVAGYCVVQRKIKDDVFVNTLQQGSKCSPIISNLVLNLILDEPLLEWLKNYKEKHKLEDFEYKYYRYSDNVVLFLKGKEISLDFIKEYKEMYRELLNSNRIWVHDEFITNNKHPFRNQRFLGIVLNKVARIELKEFSKLRAILFNCCRRGLNTEARKYLENKIYEATFNDEIPYDDDTVITKFKSIMNGKISYIKSINKKQYIQLKNLMEIATMLNVNPNIYDNRASLDKEIFDTIKKIYPLPDMNISILGAKVNAL